MVTHRSQAEVRIAWTLAACCVLYCVPSAWAQESTQERLDRLASAVAQAQAQVQSSQRQLEELKQQLAALQAQVASQQAAAQPQSASQLQSTAPASEVTTPVPDEVAERQAMQAAQIATLDQAKVGSDSRFPVRISGLILLNGFVNAGGVDLPATPTSALGGSGSTGLSLRQTVLGIDARGPHLAGASSRADLRVDFFGAPAASSSAGYAVSGGLLRFRTAHAVLDWKRTEAFFSLDRPLLSPWTPNSLTAIAQPALAWSGNLWNWLPQVGVSHTIGTQTRFRMQAAAMDVPDAPSTPAAAANNPATQAELSHWPGVETRISVLGSQDSSGPELGVGGYFSAHRTSYGRSYDAWAATIDARIPLPAHMQLTANAYRGAALGGLGGGAYKDYVLHMVNGVTAVEALDTVGGWAQFTYQATSRLQLNTAFGLDEVFASPLRSYTQSGGTASVPSYGDLARNRTFFTNAIYSPSSYLMFSFEYRHISTAPVSALPWSANIYGLAGGYRF
jgi:hypothetical protein